MSFISSFPIGAHHLTYIYHLVVILTLLVAEDINSENCANLIGQILKKTTLLLANQMTYLKLLTYFCIHPLHSFYYKFRYLKYLKYIYTLK